MQTQTRGAPGELSDRLISIFEKRMNALARSDASLLVPGAEMRRGETRSTHFHSLPELFVQVSGTSHMQFPGGHIAIGPGQVCIVPRWMPHEERCADPWKRFYNVVAGNGDAGLWVHEAHGTEWQRPGVGERAHVRSDREQRLWEYLDDAVEAQTSPTRTSGMKSRGAMIAFFASLIDELRGELTPNEKEPAKVALCRQIVRKSLGNTELNVNFLSRQIGCSADYLSNLFRNTTGHRLTVYINSQRVAQAKMLLNSTEMSMGEVGRECGYADAGYFARQFRKITGCTPSNYKSQARRS